MNFKLCCGYIEIPAQLFASWRTAARLIELEFGVLVFMEGGKLEKDVTSTYANLLEQKEAFT